MLDRGRAQGRPRTATVVGVERIGIGEVSRRTGLSVHTIRLYEDEGFFLGAIERDGLGRRTYDADDVDWLEKVALLREADMPVARIAEYAQLARAGAPDAERLAVLVEHRQRLADDLELTRRRLALMDEKVDRYRARLEQGGSGPPWREVVRVAVPKP